MIFYLGTHEAHWLAKTAVPLFVSRRRLARYKSLPKRVWPGRWSLDSGGYTELQMFGRWTLDPSVYAEEVRRFAAEIGGLDWAAPQDWMCEPIVIEGGTAGGVRFVGTKLSVAEHQARTVENFATLRDLAPEIPWIPVIQGYALAEYVACVRLYERAGIDLRAFPVVGVGSVCRRQDTQEGCDIFAELGTFGLKLHGFGLKKGFLKRAFALPLVSFDSLAWSRRARYHGKPMEGCTHRTCTHCLRWATSWRDAVISLGERPRQLLLAMGCGPDGDD